MDMQTRMNLVEVCNKLQLGGSPSRFESFNTSQIPKQLYDLALTTRGVKEMPDSEILTTFFTAEAAELLMKMPSTYFMLMTMRDVAEFQRETDTGYFGIDAVHKAVRSRRRAAARKANLSKRLADLADDSTSEARPISQIASRTIDGIALFQFGDYGLVKIFDNPFYFDPEFVGD